MLIEDLSLFFNTADFAVSAIFNGTTTVKGIMGSSYVAINGVESSKPTFTCAEADIEDVKHFDTLVIEGISYNVVGVKPDRTGIVTIVLELLP